MVAGAANVAPDLGAVIATVGALLLAA